MKVTSWGFPVSVLICVSLSNACQNQQSLPDYSGSALFQGHCASCHGPSGSGDGPVAPTLITSMQDLKSLTERNAGVFPKQRVLELIDGRGLRAAHGTPDMPVWGWEFQRVEPSTRHVQARINALVDHIESFQTQ